MGLLGDSVGLEAFDALGTGTSGEEEAARLDKAGLCLPGAGDGEIDWCAGAPCEARGGRSGTWTTLQDALPGGLTWRNMSDFPK